MTDERWGLCVARLVLATARREGIAVVLRGDGTASLRGGKPSPALARMLEASRPAILAHLRQKAALEQVVVRAERMLVGPALLPESVRLAVRDRVIDAQACPRSGQDVTIG